MSNSSDVKNKPASQWLEIFKASSLFLSSVVIAVASIIVTSKYNSKQLEISTNKDLSVLIPQLSSTKENERRFAAISLGLYGKQVVPALISVLDDPREEVDYAAEESLIMIGGDAIPELLKAYKNRLSSPSVRGWCLYILGEMRAPEVLPLALEALKHDRKDSNFAHNAASALGFLQDTTAVPALLAAFQNCRNSDTSLSRRVFWALDDIWESGKMGRDTIVMTLFRAEANDSRSIVGDVAREALARYKRNH